MKRLLQSSLRQSSLPFRRRFSNSSLPNVQKKIYKFSPLISTIPRLSTTLQLPSLPLQTSFFSTKTTTNTNDTTTITPTTTEEDPLINGLASSLTRLSICLPPDTFKDLIHVGGIQLTIDGMEYNLQATPSKTTQEIIQTYQSDIQLLRNQVKPLEIIKHDIDTRAATHTKGLVVVALGYLIAQAWVVAKLTFASRLGWDIMEPVTYLVTFTTGIFGLAYFSVSRRDYLYETVWDQVLAKRKLNLYAKEQFDVIQYNELIDELANKEEKLARMIC